ncbi:hypothetical protein GCM10010347_42150 [Streptomyces cirratus]|uniref:Uncharacterized protein n=1 Tax=Streptomyces cirratus TaxID=68187 RepID=A0ABQ3EW28_9ACTN|nr:hypothetical protein [Streptomyces cirratus]GHB67622.1 hypothetical protein GCM10010347_42150 [Streptomyces cirratus]
MSTLIAGLALLIGLTAAGASPAYAGLDGPVAAYVDQHCAMDTTGSGKTTTAVPVDRVTLNLEAVAHDADNSKITAVYTIPGTSKFGTLFGQFDPARRNVTFNYTVDNPPADAMLSISYEVAWTDGTYYSTTQTRTLLHCTRDNTTAVDKEWWFDDAHVTAFQQCTTVGAWPYSIRAVDVTLHISHDLPDVPGFARQPVWVDYWIPGKKGYTSGTSGTTDSLGDAWVTFRLVAPPTGAELDILSSLRRDTSRTSPVHKWVTIGC